MADIVSSLFINALPRLGHEPGISTGFQGWILSGVYEPIEITPSRLFALQRVKTVDLAPYVAYDFERFALSSRESFVTACMEAGQYNLAAWPILKLYYAAFFAAHALMRSLGSGVVRLDSTQTKHLTAILSTLDVKASPVTSGMFLYILSSSQSGGSNERTIEIELVPTGNGVHDSFWRIFCKFLERKAKEAITQNAPDAPTFLTGVIELIDAITENGVNSGIWFSRIRNDINYRHQYDTWFPMSRRKNTMNALENIQVKKSSSIRLDIEKTRNPLAAFSQLAMYLACLNIEISDLLASRSQKGGAFGQKWRRLSAHV